MKNKNYSAIARVLGYELILLISLVASFYLSRFAIFIPNIYLGGGLNTVTIADAQYAIGLMLLIHAIGFITGLWANKNTPANAACGAAVHLSIFILSNTLAVLYLFLFSDLTFVVRYYGLTFLIYPVLYLLTFIRRSAAVGKSAGSTLRDLFGPVAKNFANLWTAAAILSLAIFGSVFVAFYANKDIRNSINVFRAGNTISGPINWVLDPLCPETKFDRPIHLAVLPGSDSSYFVLERTGRIKSISSNCSIATVLDISARIPSLAIENGALAIAVHPRFRDGSARSNQLVFIYYTGMSEGVNVVRLSKFDLSNEDNAESILIEQERDSSGFHNGGDLLFGDDGFLYLSIGELTNPDAHQRIDVALAGGIFRIDVDQRGNGVSAQIKNRAPGVKTNEYFIPTDNPFVGSPDALEEYWALGLRNPFRFWLDDETNEIWVGDVGTDAFEEISVLRKGDNAQYPIFEGPLRQRDDPLEYIGTPKEPAYYYRQSAVLRAVIGGGVYRGARHPTLTDTYIFADNQAGFVYSWDFESGDDPELIARTIFAGQNGITSLTFPPDGEILITAMGSSQSPSGIVARLRKVGENEVAYSELSSELAANQSLYDQNCARCHGDAGKGEGAKALVESAPDFSSQDWQANTSDREIIDAIVGGGEEDGLSNLMPTWQGAFSDDELKNIVMKIRSFEDSSND